MGYKLNHSIKLSDLASKLNYSWQGLDIDITGVAPIDAVSFAELTFCKTPPEALSGVALIAQVEPDSNQLLVNGFMVTDNPRLLFIKVLIFLDKELGFSTWDQPSVIDPSAQLGKNVVIESGCVIGANTIIEHNVVIHSGTRIGPGCRIRSNSSVGGDGFGFERLECGTPLRFPHLGGVRIESNVEIGALNSIARGALSDTIIEKNVKTDNMVHIAHNCSIGQSSLVTACAELSGGVELGERVWIGPNVSMMQKVKVGSDALIGLGAVVTKNIPQKTIYAGHPAKKIRDIN